MEALNIDLLLIRPLSSVAGLKQQIQTWVLNISTYNKRL